MNFLLVGLTFVVLAGTAVACAVLGSDRLVPGRKTLDFVAEDGISLDGAGEMPLILSDRPQGEELHRVRFSSALGGYNRDEVDGVLSKLVAENARLRSLVETPGAPVQGGTAQGGAGNPNTPGDANAEDREIS